MIHDFYLGAVSTILLLNAVQWSFSRGWIQGLFTFQPFVWLILALVQGMPLSEPEFLAIHTGGDGLILLSYLELVHRLFGQAQKQARFERWFRSVQLGIMAYTFLEVGLLLLSPARWLPTVIYPYVSLVYWSTLAGCCAVGIRIAARHRNAIGWFFATGSFLLMLNEAQSVYYFVTRLFLDGPPRPSPSTMALIQQLIIGGFIVKLLCFSLCLVFWQRRMAVARALAQARIEDQLVQERLQADLVLQRLEQENTHMQLRALQAQVNPHFLFNSLNSLSSLIDEEPDRASQFVDRLSVVYRYLLKANDQPLTTLGKELDFIRSYYQLLKTRYGDGLTLTVRVEEGAESKLLPPLTLQLLVENAVKHNSTLTQQPLWIDIATDEAGFLVLSNKLQRKRSSVLSNGVGLSAIRTQYQSLQQPEPQITETDSRFTVRLSLIESLVK